MHGVNMGFGLGIDGHPIMPTHNPFDDCRNHSLYLDAATLRFLRQFKAGVPMNLEPAYPRMIQAGFYDGLGTMLPLGVYWQERVTRQSFQLWTMYSCFDMFPVERLVNLDGEMQAYINCLQIHKYPDSMKAFGEYVQVRQDPLYECRAVLPDYCIDGDGLINDWKKDDPYRPRMGGWWEPQDRAVTDAAPLAAGIDAEPDPEFDIL